MIATSSSRQIRACGERHPRAALRLEFADQAPAFRRHKRSGADVGEALRHINGRSLRAAGLQVGDDLEDGSASQRMGGGGRKRRPAAGSRRESHRTKTLSPESYASVRSSP